MTTRKPILNIADAQVGRHMSQGAVFEVRNSPLAETLGAKLLSSNLTTVPPGKAAFPFHHHYATEEHFFIVRGQGVLRFGSEQYPVKPGDYIVTLCGGAELAHQLINTGEEELVYLAISNNAAPEVIGYPDSQKTGVLAQPWGTEGGLQRFLVPDGQRDFEGYWTGEDGRQVQEILNKK